jgi:arginase
LLSQPKVGVIGVPYNTGSKGVSIEKGAEAFRNAGIITALRRFINVVDLGDVAVTLPVPDYSNPKLLKPNQVEVLCRALANKVKAAVDAGFYPLMIGGDCSVLMGIIEGLSGSRRRVGMVYMDAHGDFNTPETTPSGIIGGMDVAIAVGRGARKLAGMFGHSPLLREEDVVLFGTRDLDVLEAEALAKSKVQVYSREKVRLEGGEKSAMEILAYLRSRCDCLYLHVDLDVLDASVVSATGLPVPDGLMEKEFQSVVRGLAESGELCGVSLMAFDAAKDADGSQARKLVALVAETLKAW